MWVPGERRPLLPHALSPPSAEGGAGWGKGDDGCGPPPAPAAHLPPSRAPSVTGSWRSLTQKEEEEKDDWYVSRRKIEGYFEMRFVSFSLQLPFFSFLFSFCSDIWRVGCGIRGDGVLC
jgi:hypothetical protein